MSVDVVMLELGFFGDGPFIAVLDEVFGFVSIVDLQVRFLFLFLSVFPCYKTKQEVFPLLLVSA